MNNLYVLQYNAFISNISIGIQLVILAILICRSVKHLNTTTLTIYFWKRIMTLFTLYHQLQKNTDVHKSSNYVRKYMYIYICIIYS